MGQSSAVFDSTLFLACRHLLVCKITDDYAAEQQIWKTCPPQGIFALQKSLRVGCDGGRGSSSQSRQPPRKEISRGNLLCAESGLTNLSYPRLQSVQKYVARPTGTTVCIGQPGVPEGPLPLCFGRSPEETLPKGFLWAISSRRLDTALLCAAKKRGVEKEPAGRSLPESHWPYLATAGSTESIWKSFLKIKKLCGLMTIFPVFFFPRTCNYAQIHRNPKLHFVRKCNAALLFGSFL